MESRGASSEWPADIAEARQPGSRRRKVFDYFKAANELRQTYSAQLVQRAQNSLGSGRDLGSDFSDLETSRSGDEEMVLFPSYGRKHVKGEVSGSGNCSSWQDPLDEVDADKSQTQGMEYWESIWQKHEDDNAVVDIDVRGWIYSPHREPMSRKNRLLIALARKLSGIPAPYQTSPDDQSASQDGISVNRQADLIGKQADLENSKTLPLTRDEISAANAQLMDRLRPFLTSPAVGMPATIFFYNDTKSQSRTVLTNDGGHFAVRAALDFTPTHIRVLASESLSATEEVKVIDPNGISLISDIDDTIKHSAIINGAKEMFRNTFVRDLTDLSVLGVKEWYTQMAEMGVGFHYVSNSPWQLYPLLKNYFVLAGLPPGSMHLKQYSGMLQGILEPTAERKRPTLERIIQDFPERRFILVGDSGEADLEIYTDLVIANPGRILGIFIRDVTNPVSNTFFDKSNLHLEKPLSRSASWNTLENNSSIVEKRPPLPPRKSARDPPVDQLIGDLIDLEMDEEAQKVPGRDSSKNKPAPPTPPSKPRNLRGSAVEPNTTYEPEFLTVKRKPVPPPPVKPRALSSSKSIPGQYPESPFSGLSSSSSATSLRSRGQEPPQVPPPRRSGTNTSLQSQSSSPRPVQDSRLSVTRSDGTLTRPSSSSALAIPPSRISTPQSMISEPPLPNKREEAWRRRWIRAKEILNRHGVGLYSWRVGNDAQEICARLVKKAELDGCSKVR